MPWAAPPNGRKEARFPEVETVAWLFGRDGLVSALARVIKPEVTIMLADSYAARNRFDMEAASRYWWGVSKLMPVASWDIVRASDMESLPVMPGYQAEEAYALERLKPVTQQKVVQAARKYSSPTAAEAYESAADYAMRRAAEARFVETNLQALWVSLNWPERDMMCGDAPRIYAPEAVRTPWLKGA